MRHARLFVVGLIVVAALAFQDVRTHPFVFEDTNAITDNGAVTGAEPVHYTRTRWLTVWTYRATYDLVKDRPALYHLTNLGIHLTNGALVAELAGLYLEPEGVVIAAALFLLHPLQSEAVNYAAARTDLLSTLAILGALLIAWRGAWGRRLSWLRAAGVIACGLVAFSVKESAIVLVPLLLLDRRYSLRAAFRRYGVPVLVLGMVPAGALAYTVIRNEVHVSTDHTVLGYAALQMTAVAQYLWMVIDPRGFTVDHDIEVTRTSVVIACGVSGALLAAWACWQRRTVIGFGALWMFVALSPRFVMRITEFISEHQTYLPWIGVWLAIGYAGQCLARWSSHQRTERYGSAVFGALLATLTLSSVSHATAWESQTALWDHANTITPNKARVVLNAGTAWDIKGDTRRAGEAYVRVIALVPNVFAARHNDREAWSAAAANLGRLSAQSGNADRAMGWLNAAVSSDPENAGALYNRALLEMHLSACVQARADYVAAMAKAPTLQAVSHPCLTLPSSSSASS